MQKSSNLKCTRQSRNYYVGNGYQCNMHIKKSKDKLIRVSSICFSFSCSLEFKISLVNKISSSNLWCLVPKVTFSSTRSTFRGYRLHFRHAFSDNLSRKNCIYLFFSEGVVTNPEILLIYNADRNFLFLPTGTVSLAGVASYIPSFVAIFHNYISFCRLSSIFKQIISKR